MTSTNLDTVQRLLAQLSQFVPRSPSYAPLHTPALVWCEVDARLGVHAVVTIPAASDPGGDLLRTLKMGDLRAAQAVVIREGSGEPTFTAITPPLFSPAFPVMAPRPDGGYVVAIRALAERDATASKLRAYDAMVTPMDAAGAPPIVVAKRVSSALRIAVAPDGTVFVIGQEWFPPQSSPSSIPLWLVALHEGRARTIASPIPGTDAAGCQPSDVAMFASADGRVHVVHDGARATPRSPAQRHHVILDGATGELIATRSLGPSEHRAIRTAIVPSPDGALFFAAISERRDAPGALVHTLDRLQAEDAPGAEERYLVDFWLRAHRVRFDPTGARFDGPTSILER